MFQSVVALIIDASLQHMLPPCQAPGIPPLCAWQGASIVEHTIWRWTIERDTLTECEHAAIERITWLRQQVEALDLPQHSGGVALVRPIGPLCVEALP